MGVVRYRLLFRGATFGASAHSIVGGALMRQLVRAPNLRKSSVGLPPPSRSDLCFGVVDLPDCISRRQQSSVIIAFLGRLHLARVGRLW